MTEERLPLAELLAKAGDGDFLRGVAEAVVRLLMETDVEGLIGAGASRAVRRAHDPTATATAIGDLVQAMGLAGISKSTVGKLCKDIDDRANAFLDRPLAGEWPYLWLDATYLKQRRRPDRLRRGDNRRGRQHRGQAGDRRPAYRPVGSRDVLGDFPQEHASPRPARGPP